MISGFRVAATHYGSRDNRQRLSTPRPGFGLLGARHNDTVTGDTHTGLIKRHDDEMTPSK
jgi:hypothetical protein